jgi:hypothetical protein
VRPPSRGPPLCVFSFPPHPSSVSKPQLGQQKGGTPPSHQAGRAFGPPGQAAPCWGVVRAAKGGRTQQRPPGLRGPPLSRPTRVRSGQPAPPSPHYVGGPNTGPSGPRTPADPRGFLAATVARARRDRATPRSPGWDRATQGTGLPGVSTPGLSAHGLGLPPWGFPKTRGGRRERDRVSIR